MWIFGNRFMHEGSRLEVWSLALSAQPLIVTHQIKTLAYVHIFGWKVLL
jgi:hypothetical protein